MKLYDEIIELVKNEKVEFNGPAIVADKLTYQTTQPDVFVGGDVYTGPRFAIDAIAAGKVAAESLHRYVHDAHMKIGRNRWEFTELDKNNISVPAYDTSSRQTAAVDTSLPAKSFKDAITLHRDHPECSEMTVAEDKFKKILPYQAKRAIRIALHKKN